MSLTAIDGGRGRAAGRSAAEALEQFVCDRSRGGPGHRAAEAIVIAEVLASFLYESRDALGLAPEDEPGGGSERELLGLLPARLLARAAAPCLRLFPYQCVVSRGVLEVLEPAMRGLVDWLVARADACPADARRFARKARQASTDLRRHRVLQQVVESFEPPLLRLGGGERAVGHFLVTSTRPESVDVCVPGDGSAYRVLLPLNLPVRLRVGHVVSLALQQTTLGWLPLAATLPILPADLDALIDECLAPLGTAAAESRSPS